MGYGKVSASTGRPRSEGRTLTDATVGPRGRRSANIDGSPRARLNPSWVAQLMGFPENWLDVVEPGCGSSETPSFRKSPS